MQPPHLRPLSTGEILDRAFSLYRAHLPSTLAIAAVAHIPVLLFYGIPLFIFGGLGRIPREPTTAGVVPYLALMTAAYGVSALLGFGGLTYFQGRAYMGHPVMAAESLRQGVLRAGPLAAAGLLVGIGMGMGLIALLIGAVVVWVLTFAVVPAVVLERADPVTAIRRSVRLAAGDGPRIFAILVLAYVIGELPEMAVSFTLKLLTEPGMILGVLRLSLGMLIASLTLPFSIAVTVILYYDRRVRVEALDMQLAAGIASA